jgi:hypothetical protein
MKATCKGAAGFIGINMVFISNIREAMHAAMAFIAADGLLPP